MPGIFDLHTHFFGPVFFRSLAAAADPRRNLEPGFARLRAAGIEPIREDAVAHAARWLGEMDRHGVDGMATFASLPEEIPSVAEGVAASTGRLLLFGLVNPAEPNAPRHVADLVERHRAHGLVLFPAMHRYDLSDAGLDPFYHAVEAHNLPLVTHMGTLQVKVRDILGLPSDFDIRYAAPARLARTAERFPLVRFIVPHFGGGYFEETMEVAAACGNVAVDTSSSNAWTRLQPRGLTLARVFRRAIDVLGPERIYFGTDSSVFPRGWRHEVYEEQLRAMEEAGLGEAERRRILGGNAAALLGTGPPR